MSIINSDNNGSDKPGKDLSVVETSTNNQYATVSNRATDNDKEISLTNVATSLTPSRRILRSGSTFGGQTVSDVDSKRLRQTTTRRQPCVKKEDAPRWSEEGVVQRFLKSPLDESDCDELCKFDNENFDSDAPYPGKAKQNEDSSCDVGILDHKGVPTYQSKDTPTKSKLNHAGHDNDQSQQEHPKGTVKSDHLISLLRSGDAQTNTSSHELFTSSAPLSSSSSSSSSPFSLQTTSSTSARLEKIKDKDNVPIKCPTQSSLKPKASLLSHQVPAPRNVDFTQVQPVPDETFFVSLSKDKNKELNMLATTKGTVLVNSSIPKKHTEVVASTMSYDNSVTSRPHDNRRKDIDKNNLKSVMSPNLTMNSLSQPNSVDKDVSLVDLVLPTFRKEDEWKPYPSDQSAYKDIEGKHYTNANNLNKIPQALEGPNDQENDSALSILKTNENSACKNSFSNGQLSHSSDKPRKEARRSASRPMSQYPLMEEILTYQSQHPLDKKDIVSKVNEPTLAVVATTSSSQTFKLPSTPTSSTTLVPPVDSSCSDSKHIKRSERIRCKSAVDNETIPPSSSRQSVISTMKPINKKSKSKIFSSKKLVLKKTMKTSEEKRSLQETADNLSSPPSSVPSSASSTHKKKEQTLPNTPSGKKKKKDKSNSKYLVDSSAPEKKVAKKGKDFSKAKACMSREVMDGIVRSIEETVSRVRESADQEALESVTAGTNTDSNDNNMKIRERSSTSGDFISTLQSTYTTANDIKSTQEINGNSSGGKLSLKGMSVVKRKTSNSKFYKSKTVKSARRRAAAMHSKSKMEGFFGVKGCRGQPGADDVDDADQKADTLVTTGKRFRKKTRKAEEALGDYDIFWDEEWLVKKPKGKKRSSHINSSAVQDTAAKVGQRRSRRGLELETISSDPVLEEHAFILWASEHRSELELKYPNVSTSELDALLSAKWCDVTASLKAKYFARAKEAFSDDDRQRIWSNHSSYGDLDSDVLCGFIMDRDPVFSDFVRMPIHRQRDLIRKWLKFFQKMMPRKEYVDFMVSFKRACGRDDIVTKSGKPKRTRLRSLDPTHYKMLFDLIRLSKPRVLEVYKERRGKEKTMISNTYSLMLKHLVNNQPWPHMDAVCQSTLLTELFQDLEELDREGEERKRNGEMEKKTKEEEEGDGGLQLVPASQRASSLYSVAGKDNDHSCYYRQPGVVVDGMDVDGDWGAIYDLHDILDDDDMAVLDTSFATSCLSKLKQLTDLPVLSQQVIDQVFLSPGFMGMSSHIKLNHINNNTNNSNIYTDFNEHNRMMKIHYAPTPRESAFPSVTHHNVMFRSSGDIPFSDTSLSPNINIHYRSSLVPTPGRFLQNPPSSPYPTTIVSYKGNQCQPREGRIVKPRTQKGKSENIPKTLVGYGGTMDNVYRHPSLNNNMDLGSSMRCIRVRSSRNSSSNPQLKMPFHPYQLPISGHPSASSLPKNTPQLMSLTSNNTYGNKFPVEMSYRPRVFNSSTHSLENSTKSVPTGHFFHHRLSSSRSHTLHHHGTPSPLITSLSSLRTIKSRTSSGISPQQVQQNCQMIPCCRSKLLCASCSHQGSHSHSAYRRNLHSLPICAASKLSGNCAQNSSLQQQINVCLPSQALKIPIAKLKGTRKTATSYARNRLKTPTVSFGNDDIRFDHAVPHFAHDVTARPTSVENQSVLARVLSFQGNDENDPPRSTTSGGGFYNSISSARSSPCIRSFMSPLRQVKDNVSIISTESRIDSKVQLVSIIGNNLNNSNKNKYNSCNNTIRTTAASNSGSSTSLAIPPPRFRTSSPQRAIVVNPLHLHRYPGMSRPGSNAGKLSVVRPSIKTAPFPLTASYENSSMTYLSTSTQSDFQNVLTKGTMVLATDTTSLPTTVVSNKSRQVGDQTNVTNLCHPVSSAVTQEFLSTLNVSETSLNIIASSTITQTPHGISVAARSAPVLLSPSHSLSHLLSTDTSAPEGTERCACTACLSFNKKKMSCSEIPIPSNEFKAENKFVISSSIHANNAGVSNDDRKDVLEQNKTVASTPSVFQGSKRVSTFDQEDDSDDNREIKSISLHDAWDIPLDTSVCTDTSNTVVGVSTPKILQSHTPKLLSDVSTFSCMPVSPRNATLAKEKSVSDTPTHLKPEDL